jgi:hypothetical protein
VATKKSKTDIPASPSPILRQLFKLEFSLQGHLFSVLVSSWLIRGGARKAVRGRSSLK